METKPKDTNVEVYAAPPRPTINRFHSTSWETLSKEYPRLGALANFFPVAILVKYISLTKDVLVGSKRTPQIILQFYNAFITALNKVDELFCFLVITEGIDVLIKRYKSHSGTSIIWILMVFFIDYLANIVNHVLRLVMSKYHINKSETSKLDAASAATAGATDEQHKVPQEKPLKLGDEELPHLTELLNTTKSTLPRVSELRDFVIRDTFQRDYITLIKDKANSVIEPRKEQAFTLVKPAYDSAMDTVRSVTTRYEANLNEENSSIPRALYTTGLQLGTRTVRSWSDSLFPIKTE